MNTKKNRKINKEIKNKNSNSDIISISSDSVDVKELNQLARKIGNKISNSNQLLIKDKELLEKAEQIQINSHIEPPYHNDKKMNQIVLTKKSVKNNKIGEITWGLGIEHEFSPVVKITSFSQAIKVLENFNQIKYDLASPYFTQLKKIVEKLLTDNKPLYVFQPILFADFKSYENKYPFSNIEWTGIYHLNMIETKSMNYKNNTLKSIYKNLTDNSDYIMKELNEQIKKASGAEYELTTTKEGSVMFLTAFPEYNDEIYQQEYEFRKKMKSRNEYFNLKRLKPEESQFKIVTDNSGSYHFWMTLPHLTSDKQEYITHLHQKAGYLLQSIEPLLISIYGSPDPRYGKTSKNFFAGSYRGGVNRFANYGSTPLNLYDHDYMTYSRVAPAEILRKPDSINSKHYIQLIRDRYKMDEKHKPKSAGSILLNQNNKSNKTKKNLPKYIYLDNSWNRFALDDLKPELDPYSLIQKGVKTFDDPYIGLNIRRKYGVKGFEFRIMDHLPETDVYDLVKIILLAACMSYEIPIDKLVMASSNKGWNEAMASGVMEGYKAKFPVSYTDFLCQQFQLDKLDTKEPEKILKDLVNKLWDKVSENKKNGYWILSSDDLEKPKIKNQNKEILDKLYK